MKSRIIAFFIFLSSAIVAQDYYKFPVVNYSPREYGKNQSPQKWCIAQNKEGLIYSGNDNGLLQYDGDSWSFVPIVNGQKIFSLAIDTNGIIFTGGIGEFGFLKNSKALLNL